MVTPLLDHHVEAGRGDRPALRLDEQVLTYRELQALANRAGNALLEVGIQPEQRVALLLPDGAEFVASFLGAMKIGAVPVPLNTIAPLDDLRYFLTDSRARALVSTPAIAEQLLDTPRDPALAMLKAIFLVGDSAAGARAGQAPPLHADARVEWYLESIAAASADLETFPTGVDQPSYWLYSSGTTGRPKGTVHLHGDMLACVAPYAEEVLAMTPEDVTFSVARLFFSYGLVNSLYLPLLAGASVVLIPERPEPLRVFDIMRRQRPTLLFSVPTSYVALCAALEAGENHDQPFSCLRLAVSAGEPLPAPLYERWLGLAGVELLDGIGSTEIGYIYCSNLPGRVRPGSSGQLIGDHQARVLDENGNDLPDGEPGELWVRAESTALHYWNQRARSKAAFVGEWMRTGDRYRRDSDGYYWYLGRTDDMFKVSGQWVSPLEVESCLMEHPAVLECAVVAEGTEAGLLRALAYVVRRSGLEVEEAELQAHVKSRLQPHKYPRRLEFVDQLPKTATGKVQRYKLRNASQS
jgi:benzoate-CoA ligase